MTQDERFDEFKAIRSQFGKLMVKLSKKHGIHPKVIAQVALSEMQEAIALWQVMDALKEVEEPLG